jgi:hypothetical protein
VHAQVPVAASHPVPPQQAAEAEHAWPGGMQGSLHFPLVQVNVQH